MYEDVRGTDATVLDVDGPGMIVRLWSANPSGNIRIFSNGENTPIIDEPYEDLLKRLPLHFGHGYLRCGTPDFEAVVKSRQSLGLAAYCIIPFQKGCKVILSPTPNIYYQVNYLLWDKPHGLPSFSVANIKKYRREYERIWKNIFPGNPMRRRGAGPFRWMLFPC